MFKSIGSTVTLFTKPYLRTLGATSPSIRVLRSYSADPAESNNDTNDTGFSCLSVKQRTPRKRFTGSHAPEAPDPIMCCGSGCLNCVWIEYGIQRAFYYSDQPIETTLKEIDENINDISLREYIKREIRKRTRR